MEPRESKSEKHFIASMFKSILRIGASVALILSTSEHLKIVGVLLLAAEILGIVEEF
jgi:hypothetical protein